MIDEGTESKIYLGVGPLVAILLGVALMPLRSFTTASNFTFAFMALTILVAEYGGRRAAVATALCSALSLDFFRHGDDVVHRQKEFDLLHLGLFERGPGGVGLVGLDE